MSQWNDLIFESPVWGMLTTLCAYRIGVAMQRKTGIAALQPILTAALMIAALLVVTGRSYEEYAAQNQFLNYVLSLSAVVLAVPVYRNLDILKTYAVPILLGVGAGSAATILTVIAAGKLMGTDPQLLLSMVPKSCTTPIAYGVSEALGGIPNFTVALVVLTGIAGAVAGPALLSLLGIRHPIARGMAMGTISHAIGTTRAFGEGEIAGSMSSLAMALAGTFTAFAAPAAAALFF